MYINVYIYNHVCVNNQCVFFFIATLVPCKYFYFPFLSLINVIPILSLVLVL